MNVLNVEMLERELANTAVYANHPAAQRWVKTVARNFFLNSLNSKDLESIYQVYVTPKKGKHSDFPPHSKLPAWAKKALRNGAELHWFDYLQARRRPIWQSLEYIIHWFNAWEPDDPRWTGDRITRICWHTAAREAALWFKDVNENLWDYVKDNPQVIKTYEDGYHWVRLRTKLHFERESKKMGHCIQNDNYYDSFKRGQAEFYSLRDVHNNPHCSIEVKKRNREYPSAVVQCKGNSNQKPQPLYQRFIRRFFNDMKWTIEGDLSYID